MNFQIIIAFIITITISIVLSSCNSQALKKTMAKREPILCNTSQKACIKKIRRLYVRAISKNIRMIIDKVAPTTFMYCVVGIEQKPGGIIVSVVIKECNLTKSSKKVLENLISESGPLPYKGFEKVFERSLRIIFDNE